MKKHLHKSLAWILIMCMVLTLLPMMAFAGENPTTSWLDNAASGYAGGDGTAENPYQINTAPQLAYLAKSMQYGNNDSYNQGYYVLTANIDLSDHLWGPIYWFGGVFDGAGYTITGLNVTTAGLELAKNKYTSEGMENMGTEYAGLFGNTNGGSVIQNLKLASTKVDMTDNNNHYAGALVGDTNAIISNIEVDSASSVKGGKYVGGVVGDTNGELINVKNAARVSNTGLSAGTDQMFTGGIVGNLDNSALINFCWNSGDITANVSGTDQWNLTSPYTGGIVGSGYIVTNSHNSGSITITKNTTANGDGEYFNTGGIAGIANEITNCYNTGTIGVKESSTNQMYNTPRSGGIAGSQCSAVTNCYNIGAVTYTKGLDEPVKLAAILAYTGNDKARIKNCYWSDASYGAHLECDSSTTKYTINSGTFDASGNLTKAANGEGGMVATTLGAALNKWAEENKAVLYAPAKWNTDTANAPTLKGFASINGIITGDGGGISGAVIRLKNVAGNTVESRTTDTLGNYTINNVAPGTYTLEASAANHLTASRIVSINGEIVSGVDLKLIGLAPLGGSGNNLTVGSISQLAQLAHDVNNGIDNYQGKTITLTADVDLYGYYWTPIGVSEDWLFDSKPFLGTFDGGSKTISRMNISTIVQGAGLFGYVGKEPSNNNYENSTYIKNLKIDGAVVNARHYSGILAGEVVGLTEIENITITNTQIKAPYGSCVAGIAGLMGNGIVRDVTVTGSIAANDCVGGIVGSSDSHRISKSGLLIERAENGAAVTSTGQFNRSYTANGVGAPGTAGGIISIADFYGSANVPFGIRNSKNTGSVQGKTEVGGIVGCASNIPIEHCTNTGAVNGTNITGNQQYTGGIVGKQWDNVLDGNVNSGNVTGPFAVGGIAGSAKILRNNTNSGTVTLSTQGNAKYAGGIAGEVGNNSSSETFNNYNTGAITIAEGISTVSVSGIGGIVGNADNSARISNNYSYGALPDSATYSSFNIGGIIGNAHIGVTISNNYWLNTSAASSAGSGDGTVTANGTFADNSGTLTLKDGANLLDSSLLVALNKFIENNTDVTGLLTWVAGGASNNGYPIFPPAADLTVTVTDNTGSAVNDAVITLRTVADANELKYTAENGVITDAAAGAYVLQIEKEGYALTQIGIDLLENTTKAVKIIKLEPLGGSGKNLTVGTIGQLAQLAHNVNNGEPYGIDGTEATTITLTDNIDLSGYYWTPIGTVNKPFKGVFDGNNKTITGLTINIGRTDRGLFGALGYYNPNAWGDAKAGAQIKNLTLTGINIRGGENVGGLTGRAEYIKAENITVNGNITGTHLVGGLIGSTRTLVDTSNSTDSTDPAKHVELDNISINATVKSTATDSSAGGVIGRHRAYGYSNDITSIIKNSCVSGSITGGKFAGGFVGVTEDNISNYSTLNAKNLKNEATVTATHYAGGFMGSFTANNYATGKSILDGVNNTGAITTTAASGSAYTSAAGGIIGSGSHYLAIYNSCNTGAVTANLGYAGGIAGSVQNQNIEIINCYNQGEISSKDFASGIAYNGNSDSPNSAPVIKNCYNAGALSGIGSRYVTVSTKVTGKTGNHYLASVKTAGTQAADDESSFTNNATLKDSLNSWINNTDNKATYNQATLVGWQVVDTDFPTFSVPVTITYDANDATLGNVPVYTGEQLYTGGEHTILDNTGTLEKTGYNFGGWTLVKDDATSVYSAGNKLPLNTAEIKLYALWIKGLDSAVVNLNDATYTYSGSAQTITYTIRDSGMTLVENTHYTVKSIQKKEDTTNLKDTGVTDAGEYTITIEGKGIYGGTATIDLVMMQQKAVEIDDTAYAVTKVYDGTTSSELDSSNNTIATKESGITAVVTAISEYPGNYVSENHQLTLTLGELQGDKAANYKLASNTHTFNSGKITPFIITQIEDGSVTISKPYDGDSDMKGGSGRLKLMNAAGIQTPDTDDYNLKLSFTVGHYADVNVGTEKTVTLTLGSLTGTRAENYQLQLGANTYDFSDGVITPAAYTLTIPTSSEIKVGSDVSALNAALTYTVAGMNSETPVGALELYSDSNRQTTLTDSDLNALKVDNTLTVYYTFTLDSSAVNENYTSEPKTGTVTLIIVDGDPQILSFAETSKTVTYGDSPFTNTLAIQTIEGAEVTNPGAVTYSSTSQNVATVDENGKITIVGAGTTSIKATAASIPGSWAKGEGSYTLTVSKKAVTVTADNAERKFSESNPSFTFTHTPSDLVGMDSVTDLAVVLTTMAAANSNVGTYAITGNSTSANYNVTISEGTLTINKAVAPNMEAINKSLLYSAAHNDITVDITNLPADKGTTSFAAGTVAGDTSILNGAVMNTATGIKFSTNIGTENQTATIPVTVTMQNYEDATVNIIVKLVNKIPVTISGVTVTDKIYDGTAITYTGTPSNEQSYTGTYDYVWSGGFAPKDAGSYSLTVRIPDSNETHMGELEIPFTISPKPLTAKPKNISIYNSGVLPTAFELEYVGIVSGDNITVSGTPVFALQKDNGSGLENSNTNGNYVIKWTNSNEITLTNTNYSITKADGTLSISSRPSGGGSGTPSPPVTDNKSEVLTNGNTSTGTVTVDTKTSGNTTTATVSGDAVKNALAAAEKVATENKTVPALEIKVETKTNTNTLQISLPKASLKDVADSKAESLTISSGIGQITMSSETAASITKQATGSNVTVSVSKVDKEKSLNEKQKAAVGDAPVYDISVTSDSKQITGFDGGLMTISLPYALKPGENPSGIIVWYVDEKGNVQKVTSMYDAKTKMVIFTTNHLSKYAVGYDKSLAWANSFTDVKEADWFYNAVKYVNTTGLMKGIGNTTFSPHDTTTRGMIVTILYRLEDTPKTGTANPFTDVVTGKWYADAVTWAANNKIVNGYGNSRFGPEDAITREQLATILMNYAKFKGYDVSAITDLGRFDDAGSVSGYAKDAVSWANALSLIQGDGAKLKPTGNAERCQVATILQRFIENIAK